MYADIDGVNKLNIIYCELFGMYCIGLGQDCDNNIIYVPALHNEIEID